MKRPIVLYQKQKNVALRCTYYGGRIPGWKINCSCGYRGDEDKDEPCLCPKCKAKAILYFNYNRGCKVDVALIDAEYDEKSFHVVKTEGVFSPGITDGDKGEPASFEIVNVYETDYDFMREDKTHIMHNGNQLSANISNIRHALSYVEVCGAGTSIFHELDKQTGCDRLWKQVVLLNKNPGIEVLYNTFGNLDALKGVCISTLNGKATKPNIVMDLSKEVWKKYHSTEICAIGRFLDKIREAERKYGVARTCEFLDLAGVFYKDKISIPRIFNAVYDLFFKYRYDGIRLRKYLVDDIRFFQGITNPDHGAQILHDYVDMCSQMGVLYEKYPRSLVLAHDVAQMNLDVTCDDEMIKAFKTRVESPEYRTLEHNLGEHIVVAPKTPQELIMEGKNLHHCVAAYIDAVIRGDAAVYFLRKKNEPDKSYITLDVRDGALYQAAGFANSPLTREERLCVQEWCLKKNIRMEAE